MGGSRSLLDGVDFSAAVAEEEEEAVRQDEEDGHYEGVEVFVLNDDVSDVDDKLETGITTRYP